MPTVTVYSDYVCPYCLLAERVLFDAIGGRDIPITGRAFELRPEPVPTLRPEDPYLPKVWRESVHPLADRLGVPIRLPSISPQPRTTRAFELLAMAQDKGLGHAWSICVLRAFFQEDRDIGCLEVLAALAAHVGLNQSSVSRMVERLERAGLTVRDVCPDDKRGVCTVLTEKGRERLENAQPDYEATLGMAVKEHGGEKLLSAHFTKTG